MTPELPVSESGPLCCHDVSCAKVAAGDRRLCLTGESALTGLRLSVRLS